MWAQPVGTTFAARRYCLPIHGMRRSAAIDTRLSGRGRKIVLP